MKSQSGNFGFLETHDVQLVRLGALAERYFHDDPNTCLIKLRQFSELLAQLIAAKTGLYETDDESQTDLLRRLRFERVLPPQVAGATRRSAWARLYAILDHDTVSADRACLAIPARNDATRK